MAYKNIEMERMISALEPLLGRTDLIGYAAARNTRMLCAECAEYIQRRDELIEKYGKPEVDDDGNQTGRTMLEVNSSEFAKYASEIEQWALIEHEPEIFKLPAKEAVGVLSGEQMLKLEWMFDWDEGNAE